MGCANGARVCLLASVVHGISALSWDLLAQGYRFKEVPLRCAPDMRGRGNIWMYWRTDLAQEELYVAVAANTTGWVAWGISESGPLEGSDIFVGAHIAGSSPLFGDYWLTASREPQLDKSQDWELLGTKEEGGRTWVLAKRPFDTGDRLADRVVPKGNAHVVVALGADGEEDVCSKGLRSCTDSSGFTLVELWQPLWERKDIHGFQDLRVDFAVPKRRTSVVCTSFRVYQSFASIVGFVPLIDAAGDKVPIHHMHVHWCSNNEYFKEWDGSTHGCAPPSFMPDRERTQCVGQLYTYTPGQGPFYAPPEVGFPIGPGPAGVSVGYLILETHYDNYQFLQGVHDNSGMRLILSHDLVKHTMGFVGFADPFAQCEGHIPPTPRNQQEGFQLDTRCDSMCTQRWPHEIHVIASLHHMHLLGYLMETIIEAPMGTGRPNTTSRVEFYNHEFQVLKPENFTIHPGDTIRTLCVFNNTNQGSTEYGASTSDEMCMHAFVYYPRLDDFMLCGRGVGEDPRTLACGNNHYSRAMKTSEPLCLPKTQTQLRRMFGSAGASHNELPEVCQAVSQGQQDWNGEQSPTDGSPVSMGASLVTASLFLLASALLAAYCVAKMGNKKSGNFQSVGNQAVPQAVGAAADDL